MRGFVSGLLQPFRRRVRAVISSWRVRGRRRLYEPELSLVRLEPRRLLNADFALAADALRLDFTDPAAADTITISRDAGDYKFELSTGVWSGAATPGIAGIGADTLLVDTTLADALAQGIGVGDDGDLAVVLSAADFSTLAGGLHLSGIDSVAGDTGPFAVPELVVTSLSATPFGVTGLDVDGNLTINAASAVEDGGGSGVLRVTGDLTITAGALPGDFNGDNTIDTADLDVWRTNLGATDGSGDANGDGVANGADYATLRNLLGRSTDAATSSIEIGGAIDVEVGGNAVFRSLAGGAIRVGVAAAETDSGQTVAIERLSFQTTGDVEVIEDSAPGIQLAPADFEGDGVLEGNTAGDVFLVANNGNARLADLSAASLQVTAALQITDSPTALAGQIDIAGDARFTAGLGGVALAADFDGSGVVDGADLTVWRDNFGANDGTADANGDGVADSADYAAWRNALGGSGVTLGDQLDLNVGGNAVFISQGAGDISIGLSRAATLNHVRFATSGDATVTDQSNDGFNLKRAGGTPGGSARNATLNATFGPVTLDTLTADNLEVTAAGEITDKAGSEIQVTAAAIFHSSVAVTLTNSTGESLVANAITATATNGLLRGDVEIGVGGFAEFQRIAAAEGDRVRLRNAGSTDLGAVLAGELNVESAGAITDSAAVQVDGPASFATTGSGSGVMLDQLSVGGPLSLATSDGDATIINSSAIEFRDSTVVGNLQATASDGDLTDDGSLGVTGDGAFTALSGDIRLADQAGESLNVGGLAAFATDKGLGRDVSVGSAGVANFGELSLTSDVATVVEASSTVLSDVDVNTLNLTSGDSIGDNSNIVIAGDAVFAAAGALVLNENAGDVLRVGGNASFTAASISVGGDGTFAAGTLTFDAAGDVAIREDVLPADAAPGTTLTGANAAGELQISSAGSVTDDDSSTVSVAGDATITASGGITLADNATDAFDVGGRASLLASLGGLNDVTIGQAGDANFGSLRVVADEASVREASASQIAGVNARQLILESAGGITDASGAVVQVTENAAITAGPVGSIFLAGSGADVLSVGGLAQFTAGGAIAIGPAGATSFGQLSLIGTVVEATEDDSTQLVTVSADSLELTAAGELTDTPGATIAVAGNADFTATAGSIVLADRVVPAMDTLTVGGIATFTATGDLTIGAAGQATFGSLIIDAANVIVQEDDATLLRGVIAASLDLQSAGAIADSPAASIEVTADATFAGAAGVVLNDTAGDTLMVGGKASLAGSEIAIGAAGVFTAGSLNFNSPGSVTIQEDAETNVAMANTAGSLLLESDGDATVSGTVVVGAAAKFISDGAIGLANNVAASQLGFFADGAITQTSGAVTADELLVSVATAGDVTLASPTNAAPLFAAFVNEGSLDFVTSTGLTVANLTILGMNVAGVQILDTGAASSHTLRLEATGGGIDQQLQTAADARIDIDAAIATFVAPDGLPILLDDLGLATNANFSDTANRFFNDNANAQTETDLVFASPGVGNRVGDLTIVDQTAVLLSNVDIQGELAVAAGRSPDLSAPYSGERAIVDDTTVTVDGKARLHAVGGADGVLAIEVDHLAVAGTQLALVGNLIVTTDLGDAAVVNQSAIAFRNDLETDVQGDFALATQAGNITDAVAASIIVRDDATFDAAGAIEVGDSIADSLSVGGLAAFIASGDITVGPLGHANFGTLSLDGGTAAVQEDSTTIIDTIAVDTLQLASSGAINDVAGASVTVNTDADLTAAANVLIANDAGDSIVVSGKTSLTAPAITVGPAGNFQTGQLRFNATGAVAIQEDDATELAMASTAGSLNLASDGAITDAAMATVAVDNDATLTAANALTLADNALNSLTIGGKATLAGAAITVGPAGNFQAGTLNFNAGGEVSIQEDDGTTLAMNSTAEVLTLMSDGAIEDADAAAVAVTNNATLAAATNITLADNVGDAFTVGGHASFSAPMIAIGPAGNFQAGSLSFDAAGAVAIEEDDATVLAMTSTAGSLALASDASITNTPGASLMVAGAADFDAATDIMLARGATDALIVGGLADFAAGDDLTIGGAGLANFRALSLAGDEAIVQEDSSSELDTVDLRELTLRATGAITDVTAADIRVAEVATLDTTSPFEDIALGDGAAEVRLGEARFFGNSALPGDTNRRVARHVSLQTRGGFLLGDTRISGTFFATTGADAPAGAASIEQSLAPGPAVFEARALGLKAPDGAAVIYQADVDRFAAEAGGAIDVSATTGNLLARLNDARLLPFDNNGLAPTELVDDRLMPLAVDGLFGVVLLSHEGDLLIGRVTDATSGSPAGAADGVRSSAGHAFVETVPTGPGPASEPGDLRFDGAGAADNRAVLVADDHVFTAVAAGALTINTATNTDLVATGGIGNGTGVVTDVGPYLSYDDRDGFDGFINTDIAAGTVAKEGVLLQVTPPSNDFAAPTTRLVGANNDFTQSVDLEFGRARESNLIVQIIWADRVLPNEPPNVPRVEPPVTALYTDASDAGTPPFTHEFARPFLSVQNPAFPNLPTDIRVLSDPRINLFSEGGAQNLNRSVTPTGAATPERIDNFILAKAQNVSITAEDLGGTEATVLFDPPPLLTTPELPVAAVVQQAFDGRSAVASQERVQIEYGPLDEEALRLTGEAMIIEGENLKWEEGPANYVAAIKQKVTADPDLPAGRYVIKATSSSKTEPDVTTFEKQSTVANPYDGANAGAGEATGNVASQADAIDPLSDDSAAWTAAWVDRAQRSAQVDEQTMGAVTESPLRLQADQREPDHLMVGGVLLSRRSTGESAVAQTPPAAEPAAPRPPR